MKYVRIAKATRYYVQQTKAKTHLYEQAFIFI